MTDTAMELATALLGVERFTEDGDFHPDYLAVIARHIPRGGDGLVAELERQQGLAKAYRRAQLTAEEKLCREQANSAGWKNRSEYQATRITQLKTQCERMEGALGVIAPLLDYLPHPHCITAIDAARQALEKDAS